MNNLPAILENDPGIILVKEVPMVGSRLVAEKFGKSHKNVLRGIQNLDCSAEFNGLNFELINYTDSRGRKKPEYLMTQKGFEFLTLGFTGKKAAMFREWYVERFHALEAEHQEVVKLGVPMARTVTDALKETEPERFLDKKKAAIACINSVNMIHSIVLGMGAKHYRKVHKLKEHADLKRYMTLTQRNSEEYLQREDSKLIKKGLTYSERKEILKTLYDLRVKEGTVSGQRSLIDIENRTEAKICKVYQDHTDISREPSKSLRSDFNEFPIY